MKKNTKTTRRTKTVYEAVANNVYYDGTSYRVRVQTNGTKHSKNFSSKRTALQYRNQLLATA